MTVFLTIFTGVTVFVLGQIFIRLVIEPVQELKKSIANVQFTLSKLAYVVHNPKSFSGDEIKEVFRELRGLAAKLAADIGIVPCYEKTCKVFFLPRLNNARDACTNIVAISNWLQSDSRNQFAHVTRNVQEAHDNLGLYYPERERISEQLLKQFFKHENET